MKTVNRLMPVCLVMTLVGCSETRKLDTMLDTTVEMNGTTKELLNTTKEMNTTTKGLTKNTEEMKDTTKEVAATSKELNQSTKTLTGISNDMRDRMARMEKSTDEVKELTQSLRKQSAEIYDASRQAVAMNSRRDLLEAVYKAESGGQKAISAALYFKAFEFQLWTGTEKDEGEKKRLALMADAVKEFFKSIQEFADEDPSMEPDPIARREANEPLSSPKNKQATFNALALTLHETNSKQAEALKEHKDIKALKLVSMYSLIAESLAAEKSAPAQDLLEYQKAVLENKEAAVKILQARHNMLLAVFLKDGLNKSIASAQGDDAKASLTESIKNRVNKLVAKAKAAANIYLQPKTTGQPYIWEMSLDHYNLQQIQLLQRYLSGCLQTRAALSQIGVTPVVHPHLETLFRGLKLVGGAKEAGDLRTAQERLVELIDKARGSLGTIATPNQANKAAP